MTDTKHETTGKLIDDPVLAEVGKKYSKTGAQVALAWGIAHGRYVTTLHSDAITRITAFTWKEIWLRHSSKHPPPPLDYRLSKKIYADHSCARSVIPKSKTEHRIKANLEGDFKLEPEDLKKVDSIDKKLRFNDPSESFKWDFYTDLDGKH